MTEQNMRMVHQFYLKMRVISETLFEKKLIERNSIPTFCEYAGVNYDRIKGRYNSGSVGEKDVLSIVQAAGFDPESPYWIDTIVSEERRSKATGSDYQGRDTVDGFRRMIRFAHGLSADNADDVISPEPRNPPQDEARKIELETVANSIPDQSSLIRFGVSDNAKLSLVPTLTDENDYETIEALRLELLAKKGPIDFLKDRYALNPNVPQASLFGPLALKYDEELSKDSRQINYTILYARGARFYAARRTAAQQVASGDWPELDAEETDAIDAICDLHGPLIMASAVGRKLVEDAHQYEVPPDVFKRDQKTIEEFGQVIAAETEIMEPETAEAYKELTIRTEGDPHPARSRGLGIAATSSALTVIVGGSAWYGAGGTVAALVVPAAAIGAAGLVGGFFWEAIKTMPRFKRATSVAGKQFEKAIDKAEKHADQKERVLLERMAELVVRKRDLFERVSNLRPEFGWAQKFIRRPKPTKQTASFDVVKTVNAAVSSLVDPARRSNIEIRSHYPVDILLAVGESQDLDSVLKQVISSAIVHSRPLRQSDGRKIPQWIEVKVSGLYRYLDSEQKLREIHIDISDWGARIPESDLSGIFKPGFRGSSTSAWGRGTGLSMARSLMDKNEGSISVTSSQQGNLTFSLSLKAYRVS